MEKPALELIALNSGGAFRDAESLLYQALTFSGTIGREREILRIAQILSRRKKNNPIIIGEPGCGKTAIVEGLAMKILSGDCPKNLMDKRIVELDLTSVVAGTKYRGQFGAEKWGHFTPEYRGHFQPETWGHFHRNFQPGTDSQM